MSIELVAQVNGAHISLTKVPPIASGSAETINIRFELSSEWSGLSLTAVFTGEAAGGNIYTAEVDSDTNICVIPTLAIANPGKLEFGIYGGSTGHIMTSDICTYNICKSILYLEQNQLAQNPSDLATHPLMKPSPLMPDGKWVKVVIKLSAGNILSTYISDTSFGLTVPPAASAGYLSVKADNAAEYCFGECRMSMDATHATLTDGLQMQGSGNVSNGWFAYAGQQIYYINRQLSYLTAGYIIYTVWCYMVPTEALSKPIITQQPAAKTVVQAGDDATISVGIETGGVLGETFQWQCLTVGDSSSGVWTNCSGETSSTITIGATSSMNGYKYRCLVTFNEVTTTSEYSELVVYGTDPTPSNDMLGGGFFGGFYGGDSDDDSDDETDSDVDETPSSDSDEDETPPVDETPSSDSDDSDDDDEPAETPSSDSDEEETDSNQNGENSNNEEVTENGDTDQS